ncbi:hypothetical protein [Methylovulum psychrotolerans]|uniref:Cobalamin ABC transporter n=1 Tax=Methylovulum psychrotolerans TaxID=1704499 RepID=A0A2S5CJN4_9GAMM|nr:hypothetical protein [Methylovulum psychrotolerans]POZ51025.1 hypothetical protein AADEFJLK_02982 [Methylovulum psychrotolerans]
MKLTMNNTAILPLLALMAATRVHHFGSAWSLPDASLAVFFLAGLYVSQRAWLAGLLLAAGLLDYLAINQFNVSDWCMSPAYGFLIPTYAVMWLAGRYCRLFMAAGQQGWLLLMALAAASASVAFVISNGSFFLFSGRYADMPMVDYSLSVSQYFPAYVGAAVAYAVAGFAVVKAVGVLMAAVGQEKAV